MYLKYLTVKLKKLGFSKCLKKSGKHEIMLHLTIGATDRLINWGQKV